MLDEPSARHSTDNLFIMSHFRPPLAAAPEKWLNCSRRGAVDAAMLDRRFMKTVEAGSGASLLNFVFWDLVFGEDGVHGTPQHHT